MPMCNKSRASLSKVQERKVVKKKKVKQIKDMKNGRKGPLSLLKKSSSVSCNNNIVPGSEERDRRMLVKTRRVSNMPKKCFCAISTGKEIFQLKRKLERFIVCLNVLVILLIAPIYFSTFGIKFSFLCFLLFFY